MNGKELLFTECSGLADDSVSYTDGWVNSAQWWMTELLLPTMQRNFTLAMGWNLALDNQSGPRVSGAYCDNCLGAVQVQGPGVSTQSPQQALLGHFALASANLTRFGGGPAHHTPLNLTSTQAQKCLGASAFTAPWGASGKKAKHAQVSNRYGLVIHNTCSNMTDINVAMQSSGKVQNVKIPMGVTTLVWSL